jgi:hypothetical protein
MLHNSIFSPFHLQFILYLTGNFVFLENSLAKVNNNISAKVFREKMLQFFLYQILKCKIDIRECSRDDKKLNFYFKRDENQILALRYFLLNFASGFKMQMQF